MNLPNFLSRTKKFSFISLAVLALLLGSGALQSAAATPSSSTTIAQSSYSFRSAAPTFLGTAGAFLSGPTTVSSVFGSSSTSISASSNIATGTSRSGVPSLNPKLAAQNPSGDAPTVDCSSSVSGCEPVTTNSGGAATNGLGLNAVENQLTFGYTVEPPDQALCANSEYVMESLNIGIVQVYSASTLQPVSGVVSLDNILGLSAKGWGSAGDVSCLYDPQNGGHWFMIEIVSASPEPQSPFNNGCFTATPNTCREGIAVSVTDNPMGTYYVYFLNPNLVNNDPGTSAGTILNDYAKIGTTRNSFMLFYDEFNLGTTPKSGFGQYGFNGAQEFAFDKSALESGTSANNINVAYENMGTAKSLYPIPGDCATSSTCYLPAKPSASCFSGLFAGAVCWYQVIPAQTPDSSQYDNSNGGTGWMIASLDFLGAGDNRVAAFDWTGLCAVDNTCSNSRTTVRFGGTLYTVPQTVYRDEGFACLASTGSPDPSVVPSAYCGLGEQKSGPTPLGANCVAFSLNASDVASCPESGLATNGDGVTQASYANGELWAAVSTQLVQAFHSSSETRMGAVYWGIGSNGEVENAGYVTASHEDIEFPAIAATDGRLALMSFTLSGPDYYPSSAYTWLSSSQSNVIHITAAGESPEDGFSEYLGYTSTYGTLTTGPRWGDYGQAIFVPTGTTGTIFFASEYIQNTNCNNRAFINTITSSGLACHGTRAVFANWGSSINSISVP